MGDSRKNRSCLAIVLAAGEGKRMRSVLPKVLHPVAGRAMLAHVLAGVEQAGADSVAVVIGPDRQDVAAEALTQCPAAEVFTQSDRLGTAHAVLAAKSAIERGYDDILIVFADTPLVTATTFQAMRAELASGALVAALGFHAVDPAGYGRLLIEKGELLAIREHKDASAKEQRVDICNAGLMAVSGSIALDLLSSIGNENAQGEYYLTDIVAAARAAGGNTLAVMADEQEVLGVNDRIQLAAAEQVMQSRLRAAAMRGGATLMSPESVHLSFDTILGQDVVVEPNVFFGTGVRVADRAIIRASSHLEGASVGKGASIGPFARLRPGADIGAEAKIGNFVEVKAAQIGEGAAVSHLSYIGDAKVGAKANIGAGTITCNYDGYAKYITDIGAGSFVGSNSSLVAPVKIGDGAYVGSGSVITKNVEADDLAIARGRQEARTGWALKFRTRMARLKKK